MTKAKCYICQGKGFYNLVQQWRCRKCFKISLEKEEKINSSNIISSNLSCLQCEEKKLKNEKKREICSKCNGSGYIFFLKNKAKKKKRKRSFFLKVTQKKKKNNYIIVD